MSYWAQSFISQCYLQLFESLLFPRVNNSRFPWLSCLTSLVHLVALVRSHISGHWREWTRGIEMARMSGDHIHLGINCGRGSMDATFKELLLLLLLLRLIQFGIILYVIGLILEGVICGTDDIHTSVLESATRTGDFTYLWLEFGVVCNSSIYNGSSATVYIGELKITGSSFKVSCNVTSFMLLVTIILLKTAKFVELLLLG